MKTCETFTATIYVGFLESDKTTLHTIKECELVCQRYVDEIGGCVTVTPTRFIYSNGQEDGAAIGVINYPRFPIPIEVLRGTTLGLAEKLLEAMGQKKVSIVFPDETVMIVGEQ